MGALRLSLHELEGLLEEYAPMVGMLMEKVVEKYTAVLAEVGRRPSTKNEKDIDTS